MKRGTTEIYGVERGQTPIRTIFRNGYKVFGSEGHVQTPCFEVVDALSGATGDYVDVYNNADEKWYKKNNLNEYEEYGIMPTVDSLSGVTYYVGKLVVLSTDSHEYKWNGSSWTDLGEMIDAYTEYEYVQGNGTSYILTDYIPKDNTRIEADILGHSHDDHIFGALNFWSTTGSAAKRCRVQYSQSSNIRYDFGDNRIDLYQSGLSNRLAIKLDNTGGYLNGTKIANFTSSTVVTGCESVLGIFCAAAWDYDTNTQILQPGALKYSGKIYSLKVYEGETLVRNFVPAEKDGVYGMYETVNGVMYGSEVSTPFTVGGSSTEHGSVPEEYDTKVAPANHVEYQTLEQLEAMECPWVGMEAKVSGVLYLYTENGWEQQQNPCFEVVDVLSAATGNYVDVYNQSDAKWYKKNNLAQYEEYGLMPTVDSLSGVTYYTGKLVILSTDNHEYRWNVSEWVDLGECEGGGIPGYKTYEELECTADHTSGTGGIDTGYYFSGDISKVWCKYYAKNRNKDFRISHMGGYAPKKGYGVNYFGSIGYAGGNYYINGVDKFTNNGWVFTGNSDIEFAYDRDAHTLTFNGNTKTFSAAPDDTSSLNLTFKIFDGINGGANVFLYQGEKFYGYKIWNNGTLAADMVPAKRLSDNAYGVYDLVRNIFCECTGLSMTGNTETSGGLIPVVDYDTKVAPANNVSYNTLEELEMMECPWYGMRAYVNGVMYEYGDWGWQLPNRFITFTSDGEWTDSAYSFTDYLTQQSNNEKDMNGYKCVKVEWLGYPEFFINIDTFVHTTTIQYLCAMDMDGDKPASIPAYNTTGVKYSTYGNDANPNTLSNYKPVYYPNDGDLHHAWIVYRQSSGISNANYPNKGYIAILDYTTVNTVEYRASQTEYLGSNGTYYEKLYQWYQKGGTWSQSNNYKQGEQLQTVNRVSKNEYLGSDGTYYQKVYVDVVTPDGTQRSTGYYIHGSQLSTRYRESQTEYIGNDPYYAKSWCYALMPSGVWDKTTYYVAGQQLNTTETWKGETILWDDGKRYKYNVVNIELLDGSTVQANDLATRKGDYIEDVTPVVPSSGYTQLDWIETTNYLNGIYKPRVDLGFAMSGTCDVYIDMVIPQTPTNNVMNGYYRDLFGADKFWLVSALDPGFKCCMGACYNTSIMLWNQSPYYRWPLFNERHVFNYNNTGVYYKSYSASTWSDMSAEIAAEGHTIPVGTDKVSDYDVWLFARNKNGSFYNSIVRVYNVTIKDKDSGTVLHNFVPCFQASSNKLGYYDTVTDSFRETYTIGFGHYNENFNCGVTCIEGTTTNSASTYSLGGGFTAHVVDNGQAEKPFYCNYNDVIGCPISFTLLSATFGRGTKTITKFNGKNMAINSITSFCFENKELTSVDFSGFDYVGTDLASTFNKTNITYINANGWDTSNVTNMYATFADSDSLVECDIRSWSTESIQGNNYESMFRNCTALNKLYIGSGFFNSPTITNYNMFKTLSAWTDPTSLAMFVDAITSHDGTGKTVKLHANTKAALTSAQIAAIEAANWTIA